MIELIIGAFLYVVAAIVAVLTIGDVLGWFDRTPSSSLAEKGFTLVEQMVSSGDYTVYQGRVDMNTHKLSASKRKVQTKDLDSDLKSAVRRNKLVIYDH